MNWRHAIRQAVSALLCVVASHALAADPLPSWNEGPNKRAIKDFVTRVTAEGTSDFVRPSLRIATFDNDGTLWCEMPMYTQFVYGIDRVQELASLHPDWKTTEPYKSALADNIPGLLNLGEKAMIELMMAGHAGMTTDAFDEQVNQWLARARHPRFHRPYTSLVYQPMLELIAYLHANEFKCHIVSGGGIDFMRVWTDAVYGVPPERVVGTSIKTRFEIVDGQPLLTRLPELEFVDDGPGKPVGIHKFIGVRPIAAFGNSDGDLEMLEYVTYGEGARLGMIVHHTDAEREYAYDRESLVGRLDKALDLAPSEGWRLIDMKRDWNRVFPDAN